MALIASTDEPYFCAMSQRLSPYSTTYSRCEAVGGWGAGCSVDASRMMGNEPEFEGGLVDEVVGMQSFCPMERLALGRELRDIIASTEVLNFCAMSQRLSPAVTV